MGLPHTLAAIWGSEVRRQIFHAYEQRKENTKVFLSCCSQLPAPVYHGCNICCPIKQQLQLEPCPGSDHFIASSSCTCSQCFNMGGTTRVPYLSPGITASLWHVLSQQHQTIVTPNGQQRSHCTSGWEGRSSTFSSAMWNGRMGKHAEMVGRGVLNLGAEHLLWDCGFPEYRQCRSTQQNGARKEAGLFWETAKTWGLNFQRHAHGREVLPAKGCCASWEWQPFYLPSLLSAQNCVSKQKISTVSS